MPSNAGSQNTPKRRIMRSFKLNEISGVDRPAQEGARMVLMKRADGEEERNDNFIAKGSVLTHSNDGHTHLLALLGPPDGVELNSGMTSYTDGHQHPWVRTAAGEIIIGEARGHTHTLAEISKDAPEGVQATTEEEVHDVADDNTQKQLEAVQAELAISKAVSGLNDVQKAHYNSLDDAAKASFLAKSNDERQSVVDAIAKAAEDDNAVVYKSDAGLEFRKSDDPRLIQMAKQSDADRKKAAEAEAALADERLTTKANTEFKHLPGDVDVRKALIKSAESIEDKDLREKSLEALKSQAAAIGKSFTTVGHTGGQDLEKNAVTQDGEAELQSIADELMKADPTLSEAVAYTKAMDTPRGQQAYAKSIGFIEVPAQLQ